MDLITNFSFRMMARNKRSSYFGQTYPGISNRTLTNPGKMSLITLITPAGVHPPSQMVWKTSTTPVRLRQTLTVHLCRLPSWQETLLSHWHMHGAAVKHAHSTPLLRPNTLVQSTQHHTHARFIHGWQTSCTLRLISWKDVVYDLACTFQSNYINIVFAVLLCTC